MKNINETNPNENQNIGISEDRMRHILQVARKSYQIAKEKKLNEEDCKKAFLYGYLHDVGYEFSKDVTEHPLIGYNLLNDIFSIQLDEIKDHGDPTAEQILFLSILNEADMKTDSKGNDVTVQQRLKDVENRYGNESIQYKNMHILAKKLNLIKEENTLESYIKIIKPKVFEIFKNDSTGHDIKHLERTMRLALFLQKKEGGDEIVIGISAFVHDIHRLMQTQLNRFVEPIESLDTIKEILKDTNLSKEQVNNICECVKRHEEYNWNENDPINIEIKIMQDADNLDVIGAIGIARCFTYGGAYNIPLYDEDVIIEKNTKYKETYKDASSIHHFFNKILKLEDNMNTESAKKLAKERGDIIRKFIDDFLIEWNFENLQ